MGWQELWTLLSESYRLNTTIINLNTMMHVVFSSPTHLRASHSTMDRTYTPIRRWTSAVRGYRCYRAVFLISGSTECGDWSSGHR